MKITLLCSDEAHPINDHLMRWIALNKEQHEIDLVRQKKNLAGGDILFMISCSEIIGADERSRYRSSLILHASDLPRGRGWSPHIWRILEGAQEITLSLIEAEDRVDSGRIWHQETFPVSKDALWNEINNQLFDAELSLINFAIAEFNTVKPRPQESNIEPTYYPRRTPSDSQIDPELSIASQFNQIRISDPNRFPAFFSLHGHRYKIILEKINDPLHQD